MNVKMLKDFLDNFTDDTEISIKMPSGNEYKIREEMITQVALMDEKKDVCKIYIK